MSAAIMAQMGFSGVWDVLDAEHNVLIALSTDPKPEEMVAGLGKISRKIRVSVRFLTRAKQKLR